MKSVLRVDDDLSTPTRRAPATVARPKCSQPCCAQLRRPPGDAYDLPYFSGSEACLHLLSLISPVDADLAVAYPPLMPAALWVELKRRGIRLLEVPEEEFLGTQATNVLAVAPRRCVMLEHNPVTRRLLEAEGCEVTTFPGEPLSFKAERGPTCLTRPVLPDP